VVLNDKIYVFGGGDIGGGGGFSTVYVYDPATDNWTSADPMPFEWLAGSASVVDGSVYLIGGSSTPYPHQPFLATVWEYTPEP
jgi:N-acetylneuraminic acid mutarotase